MNMRRYQKFQTETLPSLGISYPNANDRRQAAAQDLDPGGDIFLHGRGIEGKDKGRDWTAGCVAVEDAEITVLYAQVRPGTPILLLA
jgi:murein L,D-transpeptidase YafK